MKSSSPALAPALLAASALAAVLTGCPEERPAPHGESRPPQATIAVGDAGAPDVLSLHRPAGPEWFAVYIAGKKAGWSRSEIGRELRDGKEVLVTRETMFLRVKAEGKPVERGQEEERIFEARPGGRLLVFTTAFTGDGGERTLRGTCTKDRCTVKIEAAGRAPEERVVEVTETAEQADPARLAAARRGVVRGHTLETLRLRAKEQEDLYVGREKMVRPGVEQDVSVVAEQEVGDRLPAEYRIADDGRVLEVRQGEAFVALPEPEARARSLEDVDLPVVGRVDLPRPLPSNVPAVITYELKGLPRAFWRDTERQRFEPAKGDVARLTVTARAPLAAEPARDTPVALAARGADARDLQPTGSVDADAPEIVALARQVAGDAPGVYAAARRVNDHVFQALVTTLGASHDRASDVLRARTGDCTEHALLAVAMLRALGIPAREVYGLVYSRMGGVDGLYWHDWVEVRSGGEWIALDPTFGQPVADATHIALSGSDRSEAIGLIAALKVVNVEVRDAAVRPAGAKREPRVR